MKRVLIVDDHESFRLVVSLQLKSLGFDIQIACNGVEALDRLQSNEYALIFIDKQMPEMDGLMCIRNIRASESSLRPPVIIVGMSSDSNASSEMIGAGADDFLAKPFRFQQLKELVSRRIHVRNMRVCDDHQ